MDIEIKDGGTYRIYPTRFQGVSLNASAPVPQPVVRMCAYTPVSIPLISSLGWRLLGGLHPKVYTPVYSWIISYKHIIYRITMIMYFPTGIDD